MLPNTQEEPCSSGTILVLSASGDIVEAVFSESHLSDLSDQLFNINLSFCIARTGGSR
jgi:hypothetical protein